MPLTNNVGRNYFVFMRTRVVRIGNSRGIRIPKVLLKQSRLGDEVDLNVEDDQIVIRPVHKPRDGWDEAFVSMAEAGDDLLLDQPLASQTKWDKEEWQWR